MEHRFNEVAGDRPNLFVKWRVRHYIENLDITNFEGERPKCLLYRTYIEVIVNDWFVTQVSSAEILGTVPMCMTYNKPLTERLMSLYHKD